MSEENFDPPPKLKLSRKPKESQADQAEEAATSIPALRLKRPTPEPEPAASSQQEIPPSSPEPTSSPAIKTDTASAQDFDPKNPFGGTSSGTQSASHPPPLSDPSSSEPSPIEPSPSKPPPSAPPPLRNQSSDDRLEEAFSKISDSDSSHSPIASIAIFVVLLVILGGCGFGLWYVLRSPAENSPTENVAQAKQPEEDKKKPGLIGNSIDKAKAAIAKIPHEAKEEVIEAASPSAPIYEQPAEQVYQAVSDIEVEDVRDFTPPSRPAPPADTGLVDSVSSFLAQVHIGGMRRGDNPKVMLNGISYVTGELVDPATGLRFDGIREDKLAFKDSNGIVYLKSF